MGRSSRRAVVAVAVLLPVLSACAARSDLSAPPTAAAPSVAAVPTVRDPRDARGADPCTLPTRGQLAELGVTGKGVAVASPEGRRCAWRGERALTITLFAGDGGLATLARNSEPTTSRVRLAGYPALETFTGTGEFCQYDVGVAPDQVFMASMEGGRPDSCTALQAVLPDVVAGLPALAP